MEMCLGMWYIIEAQAVKIHRDDFYIFHDYAESNLSDYGKSLPFDSMWERKPFDKPVRGMYIGNRDVYCGDYNPVTFWDDEIEDYVESAIETQFTRLYQQRVYLFILNERRNPIYVFPNDVIEYHQ